MTRPKNGRKGEVSKGIHSNVSSATKRAMRADYMASADRLLNQRRAFDAGKRTVVTIANPNKEETNKRFIRVNGKDWFKPKELPKSDKEKKSQFAWENDE